MNDLSPRQKRFVVEYIKDGNGTRAYKSAYGGRNGNTAGANANRLLKNDKVRAYVEKLQESVTGELSADAAELREYWTSVMRGETEVEEVEVVVTDAGVQQERITRAPTQLERLKAAEHLAKALGLFLTKLDVLSGGKPIVPTLHLPVIAAVGTDVTEGADNE
jgi:phage terminase small subunit